MSDTKMCGIDVYVRFVGMPDVPPSSGPFKLKFIANRGLKIWPAAQACTTTDLADVHCCRFLCDKDASATEVAALLTELQTRGLEWVQVQKLNVFAGKQACSH